MYYGKYIVFKKIPKETTVEAFQRVRNALTNHGWDDCPIRFYFQNATTNGVLASRRITKNFPLLSDFIATGTIGEETVECLSNLGSDWDDQYRNKKNKSDLIPVDILSAVAAGIPKKYPLFSADFVFDDIPFSDQTARPEAIEGKRQLHSIKSHSKPYVHLESSWAMSRREVVLYAYVPIELTSMGPLPWSSSTIAFLAALGKPNRVYPIYTPDTEDVVRVEAVKAKAEQLVSTFKQELPHVLGEIGFPHSFPELKLEELVYANCDVIPRRKLIASVLTPLGYTYLSGSGTHSYMIFAKKTPNNNRIDLIFDFGTGFYRIACFLRFQTPYGSNQIDVLCDPASRDQHVHTVDKFTKLLENISAVLKYDESKLLKELDDLYGMSPSWCEYEQW